MGRTRLCAQVKDNTCNYIYSGYMMAAFPWENNYSRLYICAHIYIYICIYKSSSQGKKDKSKN